MRRLPRMSGEGNSATAVDPVAEIVAGVAPEGRAMKSVESLPEYFLKSEFRRVRQRQRRTVEHNAFTDTGSPTGQGCSRSLGRCSEGPTGRDRSRSPPASMLSPAASIRSAATVSRRTESAAAFAERIWVTMGAVAIRGGALRIQRGNRRSAGRLAVGFALQAPGVVDRVKRCSGTALFRSR